jgi:hypothetical protein
MTSQMLLQCNKPQGTLQTFHYDTSKGHNSFIEVVPESGSALHTQGPASRKRMPPASHPDGQGCLATHPRRRPTRGVGERRVAGARAAQVGECAQLGLPRDDGHRVGDEPAVGEAFGQHGAQAELAANTGGVCLGLGYEDGAWFSAALVWNEGWAG